MMAAPTLPYATSVVAPVALPTHRELRRIIAAYEQRIFNLEIELARNEASAVFVTDAIRGALPASELECALRALVATERGRRVLGTALRPTRGDAEYNQYVAVARRILQIE